MQQVQIKVKGGCDPDVIVVKPGNLPEGETVTIEFTPEERCEIPFQCQMGMLRGKVVVQ